MLFFLIVAGAAALAYGTYAGIERLGRTGALPATGRAVAWSVVALLLVNPGCPAGAVPERAIVLLDGSLSMTAAGGRWEEARREAARRGEVRLFGNPGRAHDSLPVAGDSRLAPALAAAAATGRPVVIVSDGEITDRPDLPADLLRQATVRVFPRAEGPALAIRRVDLPARVAQGDTIRVDVGVVASRLPDTTPPVRVVARVDDRILARGAVRLEGGTAARATLMIPPRALAPGEHAITVEITDSLDAERRDERRLRILTVTPAPGIVLAASQPDWDSRFLFQALRDVTELPVEGFVQLERGRWRRMTDLAEVPAAAVTRALAAADLAVRHGPAVPGDTQARGIWEWRPATGELPGQEGDWYLSEGGGPLGPALAGAPIDSFPPAISLADGAVPDDSWVGLTAQLGRRGTPQPALAGWESEGRRTAVTLVRGLWRWGFRGGSSEQAYRTLVAAVTDWLLGATPRDQGRVRPLRRSVDAGQPLAFLWVGAGVPEEVVIRLEALENAPENGTLDDRPSSGTGMHVDTLRFDPAGVATVLLDPGLYTYSIEGREEGLVAVETYSEEWFPRPVQLDNAEGQQRGEAPRRRPRDLPGIFLVAVLGFTIEWALRRRMGLR